MIPDQKMRRRRKQEKKKKKTRGEEEDKRRKQEKKTREEENKGGNYSQFYYRCVHFSDVWRRILNFILYSFDSPDENMHQPVFTCFLLSWIEFDFNLACCIPFLFV